MKTLFSWAINYLFGKKRYVLIKISTKEEVASGYFNNKLEALMSFSSYYGKKKNDYRVIQKD